MACRPELLPSISTAPARGTRSQLHSIIWLAYFLPSIAVVRVDTCRGVVLLGVVSLGLPLCLSNKDVTLPTFPSLQAISRGEVSGTMFLIDRLANGNERLSGCKA